MENFNAEFWQNRLLTDFPELSSTTRESIVRWLMGRDSSQPTAPTTVESKYAAHIKEYLYRILRQRYLGVNSQTAYRNLMTRLGSFVMLRDKVRAWVAQSRDRQRTTMDVLEEVIHNLWQRDRYLEEQRKWIAECTANTNLRNALLLTVTEEYCLRTIRNYPLIVYRTINYLKSNSRGGLTYLPVQQFIRLVSNEIPSDDNDGCLSLIDYQTSDQENNPQQIREQEDLRIVVLEKFSQYLDEHLDPTAKEWLKLYLQGYSQTAIAQALNLSTKQVYRLREKISYHAQHIFASKANPELVNDWLDAS
jgi:hypothetical protein